MDRPIEWITVTTSQLGVSRTLTTVSGLAEFLLKEMPRSIPAQQACLDALMGLAEPEEARAAFVIAVEKAGLHVIDTGRNPNPTGRPDPVFRRRKPKRRS